jgi:hypothetical protein
MRTFLILLALAASTMAMASMQSVDPTQRTLHQSSRETRTCKALLQKMERSPGQNTWRNRMRTWKCRDHVMPDSNGAETTLRGIDNV